MIKTPLKFALTLTLLTTLNSFAAEEQEYQANFFNNFAPQNALDVVGNIPGFNLNLGKSVRGLAGGGGNVLVDGIRVSAKSGGLKEVLSRIPFAQISKVVVIRGSQGVGDGSDQSIVANIIRKKTESLGRYVIGIHHDVAGAWFPEFELSYSQQVGKWQSNIKFDALLQESIQKSNYQSYSLPNTLDSYADENKSTELNEFFTSADLSKKDSDSSMQVTMRAGKSQYRPVLTRTVNSPQEDYVFTNDRNSIYHTAELGIDWRRSLSKWQWRTIGLTNFTHWTIDRASQYNYAIRDSKEQYNFQRNKWESILRNSFIKSEELSAIEIGAELTYNHINVNSSYYKNDINGNRQNVELPAANVDVEELRADVFYNKKWQWENGLSFSVGVAGEYSNITADGDSNSEESYLFFKPALAVSHQWHEHWQSQINFNRTINQLDFKLYAAQSNADTNRDQAGNTQLKPDSYYNLSVTNDYQFNSKSAIRITAYHRWYDDVLEHQLLPSGVTALVNSGDATAFGGKLSLTYSTDSFLPGGLLTFTREEIKSTHYDELTNQNRRLSGESTPEVELSFRQDLINKNMSWGLTLTKDKNNYYYYVNEITNKHTKTKWQGFVEYRGSQYGNLKLTVDKIGKNQTNELREFYQPSRANSTDSYTNINRKEETLISLTLNKTF